MLLCSMCIDLMTAMLRLRHPECGNGILIGMLDQPHEGAEWSNIDVYPVDANVFADTLSLELAVVIVVECSEEYPLFFVSGTGVEDNMDHRGFDSESVQDLGFSSVKRPMFHATGGRVSSFASNSTFTEYDRDVRQGILMLKRSIACLCCYIHGSVSLPAPSAASTFEAFFEMLTSISLQQSKVRWARTYTI